MPDRPIRLAIEAFTACGYAVEDLPVAGMQLAISGTGLEYGARAFMSQRNQQCMRCRLSTCLMPQCWQALYRFTPAIT